MVTGIYKKFGRKVTDTNKELRVRILPQDIEGAVPKDHGRCVIAQALKRKLGADFVDVGASMVVVGTSGKRAVRYRLGSVAKDQVRYFDTHKGVFAPCVVKLEPGFYLPLRSRTGSKARSGPSGKHRKTRAQPTR